MLKINKKGSSPILVSILLISVAVILIAVILYWGKGFSNESFSSISNTPIYYESDLRDTTYIKEIINPIDSPTHSIIIENKNDSKSIDIKSYKIIADNDNNYDFINQEIILPESISINPNSSDKLDLVCIPNNNFKIEMYTDSNQYITKNIDLRKLKKNNFPNLLSCDEYYFLQNKVFELSFSEGSGSTVTDSVSGVVGNISGDLNNFWKDTFKGGYFDGNLEINFTGEENLPFLEKFTIIMDYSVENSKVKNLSTGFRHTCFLYEDGSAGCIGQDGFDLFYKPLNNNSFQSLPVPVPALYNIVDLQIDGTASGSGAFACALLEGGTLKCWGSGGSGQLGLINANSNYPVLNTEINNVVSFDIGQSTICAIINDGTVKCWGNGQYGQVGTGTTNYKNLSPTDVGLSNVVQVSVGSFHSCALINDGTVKCWGYNSDGRLGDGTTTQRNTPVTTNITDVNMISAGFYHTCALINDGTVKCWGSNGYRELGDGTSSNRSNPVSVLNLNDATFLKSSGRHNCVILENKTVKCWGSNRYGQLGDGSTTNRSTPILVNALSDVNSIDVGGQSYSADGHTCVLLADGTVKCWGHNSFGQLGLVGTTTHRTPTESISNYIFRNGSNFSLYNNFALNDCFKINSNSCVYSNKPDVKNKKIIISYDGSKLSYYLNGELVNNIDEYNILTAENNFILGSQGFKGFISHFSLYKNNLPDNLISTFSKFI